MNRRVSERILLFALCGLTLAACQNEDPAASESAAAASRQSAGRSAPVTIDYEIMGVPVVGMPLSINVKLRSQMDAPVSLIYRINETTGLKFAEAQAERVSLLPVDQQIRSTEQVTVIPQREGRLFLNVSAEIETDSGKLARVMAIPIQVGARRLLSPLTGELATGE